MSFVKKILFIFFLLVPISNSFGAMITHNQTVSLDAGSLVAGVAFNSDGTKVFTSSANDMEYINEFSLSIPYDVSSKTYTGDSERCHMGERIENTVYDLEFSSNGMHFFVVTRNAGLNSEDGDKAFRFDLTIPYDISTCVFAHKTPENLDKALYNNGSNAGDYDYTGNKRHNRLQGIEISNDGTKLFLIWFEANNNDVGARLLEYTLSTPYDLRTLSLVTSAGIEFDEPDVSSKYVNNPASMRFSTKGKRIFITSHDEGNAAVTQVSLTNSFDTSSFVIDGTVNVNNLTPSNNEPRGLDFGVNGMTLIIANDFNQGGADQLMEYDLVCPFNIITGKCPSITENSDRTGMTLAQIEIAKRTIDHSTDTALNRLKWIRRNKDKQNLTNLNINFNFTNQRLASLTEVVKASAAKKKTKDKDEDVFYWSEGSIAVGRIGDTSVSSTKKIDTDALTFGADKFTNENGIKGLAFRVGRNNVDVGNAGSNLDTDTYNITYYSTTPIEDDTKFLDSVIGFGKLNSDLLTVLDGQNLTADRSGYQLYGTIRIKDEIKKDNITYIPSGRFDIGHTILGAYKETGSGAIDVQEQHIRSKKIRAGLAAVEDISNDRYNIKRHGKIEYVADIDRSSNFKYTYVGDGSVLFNDTLHSEALHNINGEIGIDIVYQNNFSLFLIYERNQAIGSGHTDKIHIAIGYLPNKETNFAFSIDEADNMKSNYVLSKNINDYNIDLKLTNSLMRPEEYDEISFNLNRKF